MKIFPTREKTTRRPTEIIFCQDETSNVAIPENSSRFFRGPVEETLCILPLYLYVFYLIYESFSDVGEIRVYFASKILTPCRMH